MNTIRMIAIALPVILLMACGGGGGGGTVTTAPTTGGPSTPPATVTPEPLPAYAITDLPAARTRVGGVTPADMTETEIITAIQAIATASDTLQIGDTVQGGTLGVGTDVKSSCSGKSCTASVPDVGTITFSLADIEDLSLVHNTMHLVGFNSATEVVMVENGITTAQSGSAGRRDDGTRLTFQSYGGWLTNSVFGVELLGVPEDATTTNYFYTSFSFGKASGSNPSGTGRAVWTGSAIGIDIVNDTRGFWQGDVEVDIDDLSNPDVDVSITNGKYASLTTSATRTLNWDNMTLENGIFQHSDGEVNVWGTFYGDNHGEVSGTFDNNFNVGSFGARRQ